MPPIDSAPEGAEVLHQQQEPKFPEPQPGKESDEPVRGQPGGAQHEIDEGAGIVERPKILRRQQDEA